MATIQKFEDLICWQKARELTNFIFNITDEGSFRDPDLKRQIRRASISPMSNIAEGFDRGTQAELIDALFIAKGEVGEVRSQSFALKIKGGSKRGLQFKQYRKPDPTKDILEQYAPEVYKRFYSEN